MSENQYPTGDAFSSLAEALDAIASPREYNLTIDEGQRQMLILALAKLAIERRGWDETLWDIAGKCDETDRERSMFQRFVTLYSTEVR